MDLGAVLAALSSAVHAQALALAGGEGCGGAAPVVCRCGTTCWPAPRFAPAASGTASFNFNLGAAAGCSDEAPCRDSPLAACAADVPVGAGDLPPAPAVESHRAAVLGCGWQRCRSRGRACGRTPSAEAVAAGRPLRLTNRYQVLASACEEAPFNQNQETNNAEVLLPQQHLLSSALVHDIVSRTPVFDARAAFGALRPLRPEPGDEQPRSLVRRQ